MHRDARAPCVGLQYGLPLGSFARWTICRLTYPLIVVGFPVVELPNVYLKSYQRIGLHLWLILGTSVICIIQLA